MENQQKSGSRVSLYSDTSSASALSNANSSKNLNLSMTAPQQTLSAAPRKYTAKPVTQKLSETSPRIISESARFIVEHYSPTEPYAYPPVSAGGAALNFSLKDYRLEHCEHDREDPYVYRSFFYGREHKNLLGFHPDLGSISISVRKEVDRSATRGTADKFTYLVKTELELGLTPKHKFSKVSTKEVMLALFPVCEPAKLKEVEDTKLSFELLSMEEKIIEKNYKFGVVYGKPGQTNEEEMLGNQGGSDVFNKFIDCIGERVKLKGYKGYRGGLDVKEDTTGSESAAATFRDMKVMYHVSTMLPFTAESQQIQRKAQIGNDICMIVFKDASDKPAPFNPASIVSQFSHVVIAVEQVKCADGVPRFRVATARKEDVPAFGPYPPSPGLFELNSTFREFILSKLINGENASYQSTKFSPLRARTRKNLLEDLTKRFLRKVSLGSTTSLSTWKSIFGTTDGLAGAPSKSPNSESPRVRSMMSSPKLDIGLDKRMKRTGSFNEADVKDNQELKVAIPYSPTMDDADLARSRRSGSTPTSPIGVDRITSPDSYQLFRKESTNNTLERPLSSPSAADTLQREDVTKLREENANLKKKMELRATEQADALIAIQNDLKLRIELQETRIKLNKLMAFVESLSQDGSTVLKQFKEVPPPP